MRIYLDSETHLIKLGMVAPRPVAYGVAIDDNAVDVMLADRFLDALPTYLCNPNFQLIGHNVAFDLGCACAERPELLPLVFDAYEGGRVTDTMVVQKLIDIALGEHKYRRSGVRRAGAVATKHGLADLLVHYYGRELPKEDTWRLRYGELDDVPVGEWPPDAIEYLVRDVESTRDVYRAQLGLVHTEDWARRTRVDHGVLPDVPAQHRHSWWMWLMGAWGVRTDGAAVEALRAELATAIDSRRAFLEKQGLIIDGVKKMAPCRERVTAWYTAKGLKVPLTDKGNVSTEAEVLSMTDDAGLVAWSEYVSLDKVLGTYVEGRGSGGRRGVGLVHGVDVPICAGWNVLVETGRTSCSRPNLQNPPRGAVEDGEGERIVQGEVRPCVIARPGHVLVSCDYDTAELRSLAQVQIDLFKTSALGDMLRAGMDPHARLGGDIIGVAYDEMIQRKKESVIKDARQGGKAGNFGYPGGLGPDTFIEYAWSNYGVRFTRERSQEIREAWFALYPEEKMRFDHIKALIEATGGVIRHHRSNRLRGDCRFTSAANSLFQGKTADGAKRAGWLLSRECYGLDDGPLRGSRVVMFLHDEFILEVPEWSAEHVDRCARRIEEKMIEGMRVFVPDVPTTCTPAVTRRWYKGAEAVMVGGFIVPCRPVTIGDETKWIADV